MARPLFALLLAGALLAVGGSALAQDDKPGRMVYALRYADARDVAAALAKQFQRDADIQPITGAAGSFLLLSGRPAVIQEIMGLLNQLDQGPRQVAIEVFIAELPSPKAESGAPLTLDPKEFTGPSRDVFERLAELKRKGALGTLKHLHVTALESQPASVMIGESKPIVMATNRTPMGLTSRSISMREVGTTAKVLARVSPDNQVLVDLDLSDARMHAPETGAVIGADEQGAPIHATEIVTASLKTKLTIPAGYAVAAEGVQTSTKAGPVQMLVIVAARLVQAEPAPMPRPKKGK
jgi:Bacterial type II/III secretion system short domain/Bacterial type II and III secretion system protein